MTPLSMHHVSCPGFGLQGQAAGAASLAPHPALKREIKARFIASQKFTGPPNKLPKRVRRLAGFGSI